MVKGNFKVAVYRVLEVVRWFYLGGEKERPLWPQRIAFSEDILLKEIICRKAPFSFYLNSLNISRRNVHCTLMVKRYKFITSYKNYHLKVILFI